MTDKDKITIEHLTAFSGTDLEDLCEATATAVKAGGGFGWIKPPRQHLLESYWKGVLLVPDRYLIVGRLEGTIAASAQLVRPQRNNEAQAHAAQLMTLFVAPWARGHGLAKRVLVAMESAALENGLSVINADVRESQTRAIKLFEKLGYGRWGINPTYARVDGKFIRGLFFSKCLTPEAEAASQLKSETEFDQTEAES